MAGNLEAQKLEEEIRKLKTELEVSKKCMKQVWQKFIKQCEEELSGKEKELKQLLKHSEEESTAEISLKEKEHVKEISGKEISGEIGKTGEMGKWGKLKSKLGIGEKEAVRTEIRNLQMEEQDLNEKMDAKQREIKETEIEIDRIKNEVENKENSEAGDNKGENDKSGRTSVGIGQHEEQEKSEFRLKELKAISETEKSRLGLDKSKINYAVTGGQAAGKSSLINGLLGLGRKSEGAAKTDIVYCTSATSQYSHPSLKDVILWDLPGVGTPDHPEETYYEDTALEAFDAIIILTGDRILDIELKIAKRSQKAKKRVVFVRSKADTSIRDICADEKITMAEAATEFRKKVEENFKKQLKTAKMSGINILIVSSRAFVSGKSPYTYGDDRSLQGMDEELVTKFLENKNCRS